MMRDAKILQIYEGTNQIQRDGLGNGKLPTIGRVNDVLSYFPLCFRTDPV
jgi:hypothetical protein